MPGKSKLNKKRAAAVAAAAVNDRLRTVFPSAASGLLNAQAGFAVGCYQPVDEALITKLSGHKGNLLLEDLQPGQHVLLNATSFLNKKFLFAPDIDRLHVLMREASKCTLLNDEMIVLYNIFLKDVSGIDPKELMTLAGKSAKHYEEMGQFSATCELLAVLRQLCFDVPIPLINLDTDPESSTVARKIGKSSTSNPSASHGGSGSSRNAAVKAQARNLPGSMPQCIVPFMTMDGDGRKRVLACYPDDVRAPDRLIVSLHDILNIDGWSVMSEKLVLKSVDYYQKRLSSEKPALQQEYRSIYKACMEFVKQEGTARADDEWRQFIANCVDVHALRHVLHGKPLIASSDKEMMDGVTTTMEAASRLQELAAAKEARDKADASGSGQVPLGYGVWDTGNVMMSFDDLKDTDHVTVYTRDCTGIPYGTITNAGVLKQMQQRAEHSCKHDLAATKMYFAKLSKSCKKTPEELSKLRDTAKIGIPKAVHDIQYWTQECLYWCVLRKVLHNVPLQAVKGRCGMPEGGGIKLPGQGMYTLHS